MPENRREADHRHGVAAGSVEDQSDKQRYEAESGRFGSRRSGSVPNRGPFCVDDFRDRGPDAAGTSEKETPSV